MWVNTSILFFIFGFTVIMSEEESKNIYREMVDFAVIVIVVIIHTTLGSLKPKIRRK